MAAAAAYDLVFLDVVLPDGDGLSALDSLLASPGEPHIVVVTGAGDPEDVERALSHGAWDYIPKPFSSQEVVRLSTQALTQRTKQRHLVEDGRGNGRLSIIGESPKLKICLSTLARIAPTPAACLITGETGTGKELFARALHECSSRGDRHFVVVDCTNIPESLAESVLFGHMKGAFTDARDSREGLIKQADKGTLFLDEIGDLDLSIQKSLLRVLQEKRFRPIGAKMEIHSDFRLIAATNRDLQAMVEAGEFRRDLYYRLNTAVIALPPLRERGTDVLHLARHTADKSCKELGLPAKTFSPAFEAALVAYSWPGNVRELVNAITSALTLATDESQLEVFHLPVSLRIQLKKDALHRTSQEGDVEVTPATPFACLLAPQTIPTFKGGRQQVVDAYEKQYFERLLQHIGADLDKACKVSGVSRARLYQLLKKHNLTLRSGLEEQARAHCSLLP
ncbi:sigma-54 dependent transcriptional regulator [Megalodesulfovibrio paquesii]